MVKWAKIQREWKEEKPKHSWTHWLHDVYSQSMVWWATKDMVKMPLKLCRTCKVWWRDG